MEAKERVANVLKAKHIEPTDEKALELAYNTGRKDVLKWIKGLLSSTKPITEIYTNVVDKIKEL